MWMQPTIARLPHSWLLFERCRLYQNFVIVSGVTLASLWFLTILPKILGSCEGGAVSCEGGQPIPIRYRVHEIYRDHRWQGRCCAPSQSLVRTGRTAVDVSRALTPAVCSLMLQELLKKCHQCMETIVKAKDQQAAEANKNASILLKELDLEKVLSHPASVFLEVVILCYHIYHTEWRRTFIFVFHIFKHGTYFFNIVSSQKPSVSIKNNDSLQKDYKLLMINCFYTYTYFHLSIYTYIHACISIENQRGGGGRNIGRTILFVKRQI